MKGLTLGVAGMALLWAASGHAADMRRPAYKAPAAHPLYNWTGFYLGGNAGYAWGRANDVLDLRGAWPIDGSGDNTRLAPLGTGQLKPESFTGGIQAGFNYQSGSWVLGVEADVNSFRLRSNLFRNVTAPAPGNPYNFTSSFESSWLATVRPRLGFAADRLLVYATGGVAIGNQKFAQSINQLNLVFAETGAVSATTTGWTAGAGAEYATSRHWSVKAEYLYVDLGSVSFSTVGVGIPGSGDYNAVHSAHLRANVVRLGVNFRP